MPSLVVAIFALIFSGAVIKFTPLSGKLGFFVVFVPTITVAEYVLMRLKADKKAAQDVLVSSIMWTAAFLVFLPVMSILVTTVVRGSHGLKANLFTDTMKITSYSDPLTQGGLLHALIGTVYLILFSILISVPLGLLTALYITEIRGRGSGFIQFIVQAMSGVPSVIAGLFIFSSIILATPLKASSIVGSLALSILMVPTVTRASQEVLALIPKSGLITAMILGVARIAGETAPLLFVLGGTDALNLNPFKDFNSGLPLYIWKGILIGEPEAVNRAWSGILILLALVLIFFSLARILGPKREKL
jgi:phosphate transport system permease protein